MRPVVSAIIITRNEEHCIRQCLESIRWADEIIVVDDYSCDRTCDIAREFTDRIFQRRLESFSSQKQFALDKAEGEWIINIDADEVVTDELRKEIMLKIREDYNGFYLSIKTVFFGKVIRYCGWKDRNILRIFRKKCGRYDNRTVHENVIVRGRIGRMKNGILHTPYRDMTHFFEKFNFYSTKVAEDFYIRGDRIAWWNIPFYFAVKPCLIFIYKYIVKLGILDGLRGFMISVFSSFTYLAAYAKLCEKQMGIRKGIMRDKDSLS